MEVKNRECVLLRKEMVVYCKAYPIKKTIPYEKLSKSECRCFKPEYRNCEQYKKEFKAEKDKGATSCPFIRIETLYFCAAFPLKKVSMDSLTFSPCLSPYYERCEMFRKAVYGPQEKDIVTVRGFHFDTKKEYLDGHIWIKKMDGKVRVGFDDFGQFILGRVEKVSFHERDETPLVVCLIEEGEAEIKMPFKGLIDRVNEKLKDDPNLINSDPYGKGWLMDVILRSEPKTINGHDALIAIRKDIQKLHELLEESGLSAMVDGGEIMREIRKNLKIKAVWLIADFLKGSEVKS
jgi:glycine cleavage system H protein